MDPNKSTHLQMARSGNGSRGQKIDLLTNHFGVNFTTSKSQHFFQYSVAITYEDGNPVEAKGIGRKILAKVQETYQTDLGSKHFAYDGDKILFTVGPLPNNKLDFSVVLEDMSCTRSNTSTSDANTKRLRPHNQSKRFNVAISFAAKISMQAIQGALQGKETNDLQDAVRVLDVILRQNAATKGCLLVRQSFFHNDAKYFSNNHGGFHLCRGFHSSFRATQGGLSLNIDVSSTLIVSPGPVIDFLVLNQEVRDPSSIDWKKAERTLKNLRVKVDPSNREYKITGLTRLPCRDQTFLWKKKQGNGETKEVEVTVYDYFTKHLEIELRHSGGLPCISVGKPKRPTYFPIEQCHLVSLQRYTKAPTIFQRSKLVKESVQKPQEKMNVLNNAIKDSGYNNDPMLQDCGVRIDSDFTQVEGRVLPTPRLKVGNGEEFQPRDGRWNFNNKKLVEPATVTRWAVVNFSARCDTKRLISDLIRCGRMKGINVDPPYKVVFQEDPNYRGAPANIRVEKMFEQMQSELRKEGIEGKPKFILCILAEKKNSLVYGPWKRRNLVEEGIVTQCIAPTPKINDQYLTNVLLKINAKMMPLVTQVPTFIVGMDVSHGSPGQSDIPSIAAVVGSREWPLISKYRACVRTQSRKVEMIDNLFKPVTNEKGKQVDEGIFWELLFDFYISSGKKRPEHIIIFRDGVSESQFNQVLSIELDQMMQACKFVEENWEPKFTVIIAQKNHHTKFFRAEGPGNVPPGTIIDSRICHPRNNDFYLCAHAGLIGTTRPTHYHVLYDEIGFSTDDLQELVHSLSYVYQRSTTAISVGAPVMYAHLADAQMSTAVKFEDSSETSSRHGGITTSEAELVPPMPKLNANVASSIEGCCGGGDGKTEMILTEEALRKVLGISKAASSGTRIAAGSAWEDIRGPDPLPLFFRDVIESWRLWLGAGPDRRPMSSHIVGYPRIGPKRELKFALESFWDGKTGAEDLQNVAADLRRSIWKHMAGVGNKYIPSNTFSYYDQMLDTTAMLGAVPSRYGWESGEVGFDVYFSMARGNDSVPAMEMTKWFDTNYHYIVPELGPHVKFSYASHKAVEEFKEAKALGIDTVPVLIGPMTYLLLSKPAKDVDKSFCLLSLIDKILPVYKEVLTDLKSAGARWIQFDEPILVMDLDTNQLQAFSDAYSHMESSLAGLNVLIATYFADVPAEAYKALTSLKCVTGFGFDLVRGLETLDLIKVDFPRGKLLFAGVVDGRNIWANDLSASLKTLQTLEDIVGKEKVVVSTSCSLLHTAVDLVNEIKLDKELKSWLAFAAQKVVEVNALARSFSGVKDEALFASNSMRQASRRSSPRVTNATIQHNVAAVIKSDHRRSTKVSARLQAQQKKLNLPPLPTTTIGSFPQTPDLRRIRKEFKARKISEIDYVQAIKVEFEKVVKLQEELGIDVLVHGEAERNDMVEFFGEQLSGFAFTSNGWVQSYGSRCVKPPIIYGDVSRPKAMTVFWSSMAQKMTKRPMKGMLTGPVTILNWSFVRNDQPRYETCFQIALAIKDEVKDLEKAGITVIQIDEAALREGLPLRRSEQELYLDWAVHAFRITNCDVRDTTQIHTHMCYSNFNDIINSIINMDADVITIENSRSDEKLLSVFHEGVKYGAGIGPGVYDIHSPRIPSAEEIAERINKMLAVLDSKVLWVNPDCGLKTRKYSEVKSALSNMVAAAKLIRSQLNKS
uniref:5-methyltetrahydropteroyltriglutamate--homocysteine S-methyltransferase n=1 Tax=Brassica campestris TaxID=3711 RepID=M4CDR8_BRACM